jgi:hypothetical protein
MVTVAELKHKRLAKMIVKTGDKIQAYRRVYPDCKDDNTAKSSVSRAMSNNPQIALDIKEMLAIQGMDVHNLNKRLKKKLDAKKLLVTPQGKEYSIDDNSIQMRALENGYKLNGYLNQNTTIDNRSVNITNAPNIEIERLDSVVSKLTEISLTLQDNTGNQTGEVETVEVNRPKDRKNDA